MYKRKRISLVEIEKERSKKKAENKEKGEERDWKFF